MESTAILLNQMIEGLMHYSMRTMFRYVKDNNLSMPQFGTLMQIYHKHTCAVSDIGSEMGISNAAASQMLDRLVQQNYIERTEDPIDRRVKQINLTDKGLALVKEANMVKLHTLSKLIQTFTPEEIEQTRIILSKIIDRVQKIN
jgi:DNA-binding MarR family transcriptional regulator